ncbi:MAG: DUF4012 domain-containing protein [Dermatophilaceae bacterium]
MTEQPPPDQPPPDDGADAVSKNPFDGPDRAEPVLVGAAKSTGDQPQQRRVRVSRRKRRRRRRIGVAMIVAGGVPLLAGVWIGVTGLMARSQLSQVRSETHTLRAEISASDWTAARATAADLAKHAHRADQLTTGPVWTVAAVLPSGGAPLRTIRGITSVVDSLGHDALPQVVSASERLDPRTLRRPDGSIDLSRIATVGPGLETASATMAHATRTISELPRHTWLSSIDTARVDVLSQLTALDDTVKSANLAVRILPVMLGQNGPKHYFVAFQNEAEARGTGGLPGAFAIIAADHGKLSFTRFESDIALAGITADVDFGPDYHHLYDGAGTTTLYGNGNLSPNFPYAAQIWASMWQKYSSEHVDGVIAVDPTTLSYLLAVMGPATLPDKSQVNAGNVVALTQSTAYAKFSDLSAATQGQRRAYLLAIASAVSKKILDAHGESAALMRAVGKAAGERRLLVWSADPAVQADLAQTSVAGIIPTTKAPYVGLSIVNDGGNKLDYYLDRSLTWQRVGCGSTRQTTVTITLTNNAPASGLSEYVTARSDRRSYPIQPGDNRLEVSYFATEGALMEGVTVAGQPGTASIGVEHGHPVYTVDLELPRGTSRTIVLHLSEPVGKGEPIVLRQPLVRPLHVKLDDASCS